MSSHRLGARDRSPGLSGDGAGPSPRTGRAVGQEPLAGRATRTIDAEVEPGTVERGFVLVELLIVAAIVGILATIAVPAYDEYRHRAKVSEAMSLWEPVREKVEYFRAHTGVFPRDNQQAGLPAPSLLAGTYVASVSVEEGAIHVRLRESGMGVLAGGVLTIRPTVDSSEPAAPVIWECPTSTDLPDKYLPRC